MTTRAELLGRIRSEMAKTAGLFPASPSQRPEDPAGSADSVRWRMAGRWPEALLRFREEFERVSGTFHRVETVDDAGRVIAEIARARGAKLITTWSAEALGWNPAPALLTEGVEVVVAPHEAVGAEEARRLRDRSAVAGIGVTGADLAVAETGTMILLSGKGRPRSTSLLPDCHVAIFGKDTLVERLDDVGVMLESLHVEPDRTMSGAAINFITGPSRTTDIELVLTRGVHGPKEVHVIFVDSLGTAR
jgi:L-lactate dehydrogenase complex protein LldG